MSHPRYMVFYTVSTSGPSPTSTGPWEGTFRRAAPSRGMGGRARHQGGGGGGGPSGRGRAGAIFAFWIFAFWIFAFSIPGSENRKGQASPSLSAVSLRRVRPGSVYFGFSTVTVTTSMS